MAFTDLADLMKSVFNAPQVEIRETTISADVPGWDSLAHVILMMEIEATFGAVISAEEAADLPNVGALYRLIQERAKA